MSSHDTTPNDPAKEIKYVVGFLLLFSALVGWIFYGGWSRSAAPQTLAETKKIIGLVDAPSTPAKPAAPMPTPANAASTAAPMATPPAVAEPTTAPVASTAVVNEPPMR